MAGYRLDVGGVARPACWRHVALSGQVTRRALATSVVVGTVLTVINQGDLLVGMTLTPALALKIPLTYSVPYCVATWGALGGARR